MMKLRCLNVVLGLDDFEIELAKTDHEEYTGLVASVCRETLSHIKPEVLDIPQDKVEVFLYDTSSVTEDLHNNFSDEEISACKLSNTSSLYAYTKSEFTPNEIDVLTAVDTIIPLWLVSNTVDLIHCGNDNDDMFMLNVVPISNSIVEKLKRMTEDPKAPVFIPLVSSLDNFKEDYIPEDYHQYISELDSVMVVTEMSMLN